MAAPHQGGAMPSSMNLSFNVAVLGVPSYLLGQTGDGEQASSSSSPPAAARRSVGVAGSSPPPAGRRKSSMTEGATLPRASASPCAGFEGVGKSSLCARFVLPRLDEYEDIKDSLASSSVSKEHFDSPAINGDHFLYFGSTVRTFRLSQAKDKTSRHHVRLHVVEQTTFIDTSTVRPNSASASRSRSLPFPGCSHYLESAVRQTLTSRNGARRKLSCIGPIQGASQESEENGHTAEPEMETEQFPEDFNVDGFVLVLDPTRSGSQMQTQLDMLRSLASQVQKQAIAKPVALAITKSDTLSAKGEEMMKSYGKIVGGRHHPLPLFFCSAEQGIGVDGPFLHLSTALLGSRSRRHPSVRQLSRCPYRLALYSELRKDWAITLNTVVVSLQPVISVLGPSSDWSTVSFATVRGTECEWALAAVIGMVGETCARSILQATATRLRHKRVQCKLNEEQAGDGKSTLRRKKVIRARLRLSTENEASRSTGSLFQPPEAGQGCARATRANTLQAPTPSHTLLSSVATNSDGAIQSDSGPGRFSKINRRPRLVSRPAELMIKRSVDTESSGDENASEARLRETVKRRESMSKRRRSKTQQERPEEEEEESEKSSDEERTQQERPEEEEEEEEYGRSFNEERMQPAALACSADRHQRLPAPESEEQDCGMVANSHLPAEQASLNDPRCFDNQVLESTPTNADSVSVVTDLQSIESTLPEPPRMQREMVTSACDDPETESDPELVFPSPPPEASLLQSMDSILTEEEAKEHMPSEIVTSDNHPSESAMSVSVSEAADTLSAESWSSPSDSLVSESDSSSSSGYSYIPDRSFFANTAGQIPNDKSLAAAMTTGLPNNSHGTGSRRSANMDDDYIVANSPIGLTQLNFGLQPGRSSKTLIADTYHLRPKRRTQSGKSYPLPPVPKVEPQEAGAKSKTMDSFVPAVVWTVDNRPPRISSAPTVRPSRSRIDSSDEESPYGVVQVTSPLPADSVPPKAEHPTSGNDRHHCITRWSSTPSSPDKKERDPFRSSITVEDADNNYVSIVSLTDSPSSGSSSQVLSPLSPTIVTPISPLAIYSSSPIPGQRRKSSTLSTEQQDKQQADRSSTSPRLPTPNYSEPHALKLVLSSDSDQHSAAMNSVWRSRAGAVSHSPQRAPGSDLEDGTVPSRFALRTSKIDSPTPPSSGSETGGVSNRLPIPTRSTPPRRRSAGSQAIYIDLVEDMPGIQQQAPSSRAAATPAELAERHATRQDCIMARSPPKPHKGGKLLSPERSKASPKTQRRLPVPSTAKSRSAGSIRERSEHSPTSSEETVVYPALGAQSARSDRTLGESTRSKQLQHQPLSLPGPPAQHVFFPQDTQQPRRGSLPVPNARLPRSKSLNPEPCTYRDTAEHCTPSVPEDAALRVHVAHNNTGRGQGGSHPQGGSPEGGSRLLPSETSHQEAMTSEAGECTPPDARAMSESDSDDDNGESVGSWRNNDVEHFQNPYMTL